MSGAVPDGPASARDNEAALWQRMRAGDATATQALQRMHLPYARTVAASYFARRTHHEIEFDEYLQWSSLGLIEALERFDPARGVDFRSFAAPYMHGELMDGLEVLTEKNQQIAARGRLRKERLEALKADALEACGQAPKRPRASSRSAQALFHALAEIGIGVALGVLLEDTGMIDADAFNDLGCGVSPEIRYFQRTEFDDLMRAVRHLVEALPAQSHAVIRMHYIDDMRFAQIAQAMGLTPGRISQIHRQVLDELRARLRPSRTVLRSG